MSSIPSNEQIAWLASDIKDCKAQIKKYEKQQKEAEQKLYNIIGEHDMVVDEDGLEVLTWTYNKETKYFDANAFKEAYPDLYNKFCKTRPGARVLRIK